MLGGTEPVFECDQWEGGIPLRQRFAGCIQSQLEVIGGRGKPDFASEVRAELGNATPGDAGKVLDRETPVQVGAHVTNGLLYGIRVRHVVRNQGLVRLGFQPLFDQVHEHTQIGHDGFMSARLPVGQLRHDPSQDGLGFMTMPQNPRTKRAELARQA